MRAQRKTKKTFSRGGKSEFGRQMLEKQKARYSYGISAGQFANYVKSALQAKGDNARNLIRALESRLDNVVLRAGLSSSRSGARQLVSHGHITVNGKIVNIPSYKVEIGDIVTIREGSKKKGVFARLDEELKNITTPAWLKFNPETRVITIDGEPAANMTDLLFDVRSVLEFYTR
jgi:small subunit ribosomal protein S4